MKIVIVGAGEIGRTVAKKLSLDPNNKHDIYLIENNEALAKSADEELDVKVITGNGARPQVLAQAGVIQGGDVDLLIACTNRDEVNMLSCWIALNAEVKHVISRTRSLEFTDSPYWGNKLGIKLMISPERAIAREVLGLLEVSSATYTAELLDGRAALYALKISENSKLVNKALKDLRTIYPDLMAVFVYVEHEDGSKGKVPNGFTTLKANDVCYVVTYRKSADILQKVFQPDKDKKRSLRKLFIVGGGKLGTQIAKLVRREFGNVEMRIIEKDSEKCKRLSEEFNETLILKCDGADRNTLSEEGIESADGYICATESDEVNLICSVIAKEMGAGKTIAIVRRKDYQDLTKSIPVDVIVDPNEAMSNLLLRVIRYPEHTIAFSMIEKINAEMLEVVIPEDNELTGRTLADIKLQEGVIVALLGRGDDVLVPTGATRILAGDHVILVALTSLMPEAAKLFGAELKEAAIL